jgi:hypothetical protein
MTNIYLGTSTAAISNLSTEPIFYVYAYLREHDSDGALAGSPYYIGKGKDKRMVANHGKIQVPQDNERIVILFNNITEAEALSKEIELIASYGRLCDGSGTLHNIQKGGTGLSGENNPFYGKTHSVEYRTSKSTALKGKAQVLVKCPWCNKEGGRPQMHQWHFTYCLNNPDRIESKTTKRRGKAGKAQTQATKDKRSAALKGKKAGPYPVVSCIKCRCEVGARQILQHKCKAN